MKVGYAEDITGNATEKVEILDTEGMLAVRHITVVNDLYGKPFVIRGSLQLRKKEDVKDIHEEEK